MHSRWLYTGALRRAERRTHTQRNSASAVVGAAVSIRAGACIDVFDAAGSVARIAAAPADAMWRPAASTGTAPRWVAFGMDVAVAVASSAAADVFGWRSDRLPLASEAFTDVGSDAVALAAAACPGASCPVCDDVPSVLAMKPTVVASATVSGTACERAGGLVFTGAVRGSSGVVLVNGSTERSPEATARFHLQTPLSRLLQLPTRVRRSAATRSTLRAAAARQATRPPGRPASAPTP
eukprot:ctg_726.g384